MLNPKFFFLRDVIFKDHSHVIKVKFKKKDQKGQFLIEAILIMSIFLTLTFYVSKQFREGELIGSFVGGPWVRLSGMMATGNWESEELAMKQTLHPHVNNRTRVGDK